MQRPQKNVRGYSTKGERFLKLVIGICESFIKFMNNIT